MTPKEMKRGLEAAQEEARKREAKRPYEVYGIPVKKIIEWLGVEKVKRQLERL